MKHAFTLSIKEWGWAKENPVRIVSHGEGGPPQGPMADRRGGKRRVERAPDDFGTS